MSEQHDPRMSLNKLEQLQAWLFLQKARLLIWTVIQPMSNDVLVRRFFVHTGLRTSSVQCVHHADGLNCVNHCWGSAAALWIFYRSSGWIRNEKPGIWCSLRSDCFVPQPFTSRGLLGPIPDDNGQRQRIWVFFPQSEFYSAKFACETEKYDCRLCEVCHVWWFSFFASVSAVLPPRITWRSVWWCQDPLPLSWLSIYMSDVD